MPLAGSAWSSGNGEGAALEPLPAARPGHVGGGVAGDRRGGGEARTVVVGATVVDGGTVVTTSGSVDGGVARRLGPVRPARQAAARRQNCTTPVTHGGGGPTGARRPVLRPACAVTSRGCEWAPTAMLARDEESVKDADVDRRVLRRAWSFAHPFRWSIAGFLASIVAAALLALLPPLIFRRIIDDAIPAGDRQTDLGPRRAHRGGRGGRRRPVDRPTLVLGPHRRRADLRAAGGAVRQGAADASGVLHQDPDRRAHQPVSTTTSSGRRPRPLRRWAPWSPT